MINLFNKKDKKVIDTSALIDSRILGIIETGFWSGEIIVPECVINEIKQLINSKDNLKKRKGERGLRILSQIEKLLPVEIYTPQNNEMLAVDDVDTKLIFLCKELDAKMLTVDYKLNELATLQGVQVLNINDLNNAIKPTFMAGETLEIRVSRKGRYPGQGIGNLDDGTMVIIENGEQVIEQVVKVLVTNMAQTSSGRLVIAQYNKEEEKI